MRRSRTEAKWWLALLTMFAVFALPLGFAFWSMNSLPVSRQAAAAVKIGMSKDEVRSILGLPSSSSASDGTETWIYGRSLQWNFYCVFFSKDGRVEYAEYRD